MGAETEIVLHPFTWGEIDEVKLSEERQNFQHKAEARCRGFVKAYVFLTTHQNTHLFMSTCFTREQIVSRDETEQISSLDTVIERVQNEPRYRIRPKFKILLRLSALIIFGAQSRLENVNFSPLTPTTLIGLRPVCSCTIGSFQFTSSSPPNSLLGSALRCFSDKFQKEIFCA